MPFYRNSQSTVQHLALAEDEVVRSLRISDAAGDGVVLQWTAADTLALDASTANDEIAVGGTTATDFRLNGATAGRDALWDASANTLFVQDNAVLNVGSGADLAITSDGTDVTGTIGSILTLTGGSFRTSSLLVPTAAVAAITADPTPAVGASGTIYRCDTSGGAFSVTLPVGVVGMKYTFVLSNASNDLTINCDAVASAMLGVVAIMDDEATTNSRSAAANGTTHDRCLIDVSAGTVVAGSYVSFTCLAGGAGTSVWFVEGCVITGDGAQAAVVFSSN